MKQEYLIWWSPCGCPNGQMTIKAKNLDEAKAQALEQMRARCGIGAYGAEPRKEEPNK